MAPIGAEANCARRCCSAGRMRRTFVPVARELGFAGATALCDAIGEASAAKMCRSIMIKGLEALRRGVAC